MNKTFETQEKPIEIMRNFVRIESRYPDIKQEGVLTHIASSSQKKGVESCNDDEVKRMMNDVIQAMEKESLDDYLLSTGDTIVIGKRDEEAPNKKGIVLFVCRGFAEYNIDTEETNSIL